MASFQVSKQGERVDGPKSVADSYGVYEDYDDLAPAAQEKNEIFNGNLKSEFTKKKEACRGVRYNPPSWIKYDRRELVYTVTVSAEVAPKTVDAILEECNNYLKENTFSTSL